MVGTIWDDVQLMLYEVLNGGCCALKEALYGVIQVGIIWGNASRYYMG